jgi:hypothetical protein
VLSSVTLTLTLTLRTSLQRTGDGAAQAVRVGIAGRSGKGEEGAGSNMGADAPRGGGREHGAEASNSNTNPSTAVGGTNVSPCPPCMPSTRLIVVFAVACINLNVAAAIAIPTAAWVNFLWDELAHVRAGCSNRVRFYKLYFAAFNERGVGGGARRAGRRG